MVMVTGGAYQGKTAYVIGNFNISEADIADAKSCDIEEVKKSRCIKNYHLLVKRLDDESIPFTEELCRCNNNAVIIIDEIGCGIIPLEKDERTWRENVGRCGCIIAANSEKVVRLVCGIPTIIKETKNEDNIHSSRTD